MKKIYTLLVFVFAAATSFAQLNYDLQMALVTPTSGSTVDGSSPISVDFTVTNNGPDAIPAGDTLFFAYANGAFSALYSLTGVQNQASGFILAADLTNGGSLTLSTDLAGAAASFDLTSWANGETCNVLCVGRGSASLSQADPNDSDFTNNADSFMLSQPAAGIEENTIGMVVYPNPAENVLNVQSTEAVVSVEVYGFDGKLVASSTNNQVDVSGLTSGAYIYKVETVTGNILKDKFIKK